MDLSITLLALIKLRPAVSGYQLRNIIRDSTSYFRTASFSQIYPSLRKLLAEGLVTFEVDALVGKQDRKMYTITPAGSVVLDQALRTVEELPNSLSAFREVLSHLTVISFVEPAAIVDYIERQLVHFKNEYRRFAEGNLRIEFDYIELDPPTQRRFMAFWKTELQYILADLQLKIDWLESLITSINSGELTSSNTEVAASADIGANHKETEK